MRATVHVITIGCGDACTTHPGKRYLHWVLAQPAAEILDRVQAIVGITDAHVRELWAQVRE